MIEVIIVLRKMNDVMDDLMILSVEDIVVNQIREVSTEEHTEKSLMRRRFCCQSKGGAGCF